MFKIACTTDITLINKSKPHLSRKTKRHKMPVHPTKSTHLDGHRLIILSKHEIESDIIFSIKTL